MIFISHNSKDKPLVEEIALRLAGIYGQDNVFYDSWSIQPGEGIIDKMEEGLSKCTHFFFFVSANSLDSKMVKLEWQNMLMKKANNPAIKFIPVRIDQSSMPLLLTQTLYIDLFSHGLEVAIRQMVDVMEGRNTFQQQRPFSNLKAYISKEKNKVCIECRAEFYLEPISSYLICTQHDVNDIRFNVVGESMCMNGKTTGVTLANGHTTNCISLSITRGTLPGFPFIVELESKTSLEFEIEIVMHEVKKGEYISIPTFVA